jgi:hypothetical protein
VFSGAPRAADLQALATRHECRTVVLTPRDAAWDNDPFARSPLYRLVEAKEGAWRIYRVEGAAPP